MTNVSAVSAGMYHTMILKNDGTLYTVGRNDQGALGDGSTADKSTPVYIP
jgi:alpha-tubulin suppressor-like RCC1 family protein